VRYERRRLRAEPGVQRAGASRGRSGYAVTVTPPVGDARADRARLQPRACVSLRTAAASSFMRFACSYSRPSCPCLPALASRFNAASRHLLNSACARVARSSLASLLYPSVWAIWERF
jgi:hypothetical protein